MLREFHSCGRQIWSEGLRQSFIIIGVSKPAGSRIGIVLVRVAVFSRVVGAVEPRIGLDQRRASWRHVPAVEGPDVKIRQRATELSKKGQPGMRRFRDLSL